jgi:hypothetical protein
MELKVNQLDHNTEGDIVTTVHWTASKQAGEFTASSYGSVGVEVGDTVIPFASLTEETVKTWLSEKLDLVAMEASLDAQLAELQAPKVASGLPWAE